MTELSITLEELRAELERLDGECQEGFTTEEMAKAIGYSAPVCRGMLRTLVRNNKAKCVGRRKSYRIDGSICWIPVYRLDS